MRLAIIGCIVCLLALPFLLACEYTQSVGVGSPTGRIANTRSLAATTVVSPTPQDATPVMLGVLGGRSMLRIGQTVRFPDQGFSIRFVGVTSDARCPISNVYCVSPGEATVAFDMTSGGETQAFNIIMPGKVDDTSKSCDYPGSRTNMKGYDIQIISLYPPRFGFDVPPLTPGPTPTPYPIIATIQVTALP